MRHQVNDFGAATGISASMGVGIILAISVSVALRVPKSRLDMIGLVASAITGVLFLGAFVIEWFDLSRMTADSQLFVRIACGTPLWMAWQIVAVQMDKWQKSKNPIGQIKRDLKQ